ncbi:MAG: nucleotidyltransferase family protein [Candidatus Brocadiaceae bacterium]|nr:nucleotidyltransferase family protein [Candidatus Brocadiaceae bacterium]
MKTFNEIKDILSRHKGELSRRFKVKEIGVFGSYVRGEQKRGSDVDILVEFEEPVGFEFIELADFLESILGMKIDLVSKGAIKPNRWRYVEKDLVYV